MTTPTAGQGCTGPELLRLIAAAAGWLETNAAAVNALNVYPVPDGDTGTNMLLTLRTALREAQKAADGDVAAVAEAIARGALMGARGNSGVILSQYLQGLARGLRGVSVLLQGKELAEALAEAARAAYGAMSKPVEGTMLTVARAAGDSAQAAALGRAASLTETFFAAAEAAEEAVSRTPDLLPVLKEAGVVDSGGQGLALLLRAAANTYGGLDLGPALQTAGATFIDESWLERQSAIGGRTWGFCTEFVLVEPQIQAEAVRALTATFGESESIVEGTGIVRVHLHTTTPEEVLAKFETLGRLEQVSIRDMDQQHQQFLAGHDSRMEAPVTGLVAVAAGPGFVRLFRSLGASAIIWGGQTMNPSAEEIAEAAESINTVDVVVLPNNKNIIPTAEVARGLARSKRLHVVPTVSLVQGVASAVGYNSQQDARANVARMTEDFRTVRWGEVTHAVRDGRMGALSFRQGQAIGLLEGDLVTAQATAQEAVIELVTQMAPPPGSLLTLYYGAGVTAHEADAASSAIAESWGEVEIEVIDGGQPLYPYLVSLE
jgi:DAK2 domain fusion protein YloV